jgi:hypothetical protein
MMGPHLEKATADFPCLLEQRIKPIRRNTVAGLIVTLLMHASLIGGVVYQYVHELERWSILLSLSVTDEPGKIQFLRPTDIARLGTRLYYPPGLIKPTASAEAESRRQEEERRRRLEAKRRAAEEQKKLAEAKKKEEEAPPTPTTPTWDVVEERAREKAKELNIAPVRDAIVAIYQSRVRGDLTFNEITVAVTFHVEQDGTLSDIRLTEPSGISEIDDAVLMGANELSRVKVLTPLYGTESVTARLAVTDAAQVQFTAVSPSEARASSLLNQLNGLLLLVRLNSNRFHPDVASMISRLTILQDGRSVVASLKIPRSDAIELFKKGIGAKS